MLHVDKFTQPETRVQSSHPLPFFAHFPAEKPQAAYMSEYGNFLGLVVPFSKCRNLHPIFFRSKLYWQNSTVHIKDSPRYCVRFSCLEPETCQAVPTGLGGAQRYPSLPIERRFVDKETAVRPPGERNFGRLQLEEDTSGSHWCTSRSCRSLHRQLI